MAEPENSPGATGWNAMAIHPHDSVAVALRDIEGEARVRVGDAIAVVALGMPIPMGHKLALRRHERGDEVLKYGQRIGVATAVIEPGEHVHVHNMASCRGRSGA